MIEYLYNCIRATSGDNLNITAFIEKDDGEPITEHCHLMLFDKDNNLLNTINGEYVESAGNWQFNIPALITKDKLGRYYYKICAKEGGLCFRQPIYFIV